MNTDFLRGQLRMSGWFLTRALTDITHDDSLRSTAAGQTINWLVGHLADARGRWACCGDRRGWGGWCREGAGAGGTGTT